jgi:hypothetical protein
VRRMIDADSFALTAWRARFNSPDSATVP